MAKPFLKFPGGKRKLVPFIEKFIPKEFGSYFEPFLGGGSLFFHLKEKNRLKYGSFLSDINKVLIDTYVDLRDDIDDVLLELSCLKEAYFSSNNKKENYYAIRNSFNNNPSTAKFICLNKTCFNGLCRFNSHYGFNVPFGQYAEPKIYDYYELNQVSKTLNDNVWIECVEFTEALKIVKEGDLVFLDPPYVPVRKTSFVNYLSRGFSMKDHEELALQFERLVTIGATVLMTNSDVPWVVNRYQDHEQHKLFVRRSIGASPKSRQNAMELLIIGKK